MLKKAFLTLMVLSLSKAAFASSLSLSVSGGWNNPTPPNSSTLCVDIDNQAGQATDEVRWNGEQLVSGFDENAGDWALQGDACGAGSGADQYATLVSGYNFTPTSDSSLSLSSIRRFVFGSTQWPSDTFSSVCFQLIVVPSDCRCSAAR